MAWRFHAIDARLSPWTREVLLVDVFYSGVGGRVLYTENQLEEHPNGAPFWSPILLIMSMTVATTPTTAIIIVTGTKAFIDAASNVVKSPMVKRETGRSRGFTKELGLLALQASKASAEATTSKQIVTSREKGGFWRNRVMRVEEVSFITISCVTPYASRRVVGQWGGAGGAICEEHLAFCRELLGLRGVF